MHPPRFLSPLLTVGRHGVWSGADLLDGAGLTRWGLTALGLVVLRVWFAALQALQGVAPTVSGAMR